MKKNLRKLDIVEVQKLVNEGFLTSAKHPTEDLTLYNYSDKCQYSGFWDGITSLARGLVLDSTGKIVSSSFGKFFNAEQLGWDKIPMDENFLTFEKEDGSYIGTVWIDDKPVLHTKGSWNMPYVGRAQAILETKYGHLIPDMDRNANYVFEVIIPEGRIVCDYGGREDLILLSVFDNRTGEEWEWGKVLRNTKFPTPKYGIYTAGTKSLKELQALNTKNKEGYVVKFLKSGLRVKLKFEEYIHHHRILTQITSYTIHEALSTTGQLDEELLKRVPDEFYDWVRNTETRILDHKAALEAEARRRHTAIVSNLPEGYSRKEFAVEASKDDEYRGLLFNIESNQSMDRLAWKAVFPAFEKPFSFKTKQFGQMLEAQQAAFQEEKEI